MKKIIILLMIVLSIELVYASCDNIQVEIISKDTNLTCENLDGIRIRYNQCIFQRPQSRICWSGYEKAKLSMPQELTSLGNLEKSLDPTDNVYDWISINCLKEGIYDIKVIFDDGECVKTLTLNLTEPKKEQQPEPQLASSGAGATPTSKQPIQTQQKPSPPLALIISALILTALLISFFILKKK